MDRCSEIALARRGIEIASKEKEREDESEEKRKQEGSGNRDKKFRLATFNFLQ